jgi:ubiquinone/menaquinone biosynthesis C-methylase UbiE
MTAQPITSNAGLKEFYDDPQVVAAYLQKRIAEPLGAVLHAWQVGFVRQVITQLSVKRVLDLAPGPARLSAELAPSGLAIAMDASWNMLQAASQRLGGQGTRWQLTQGDAYQLPFATASFDLVYSVRFIRRFDRPRRNALYAEIKRVLKPHGFFIMDAQNRTVALPHRVARGLERYPVYDELFLLPELEGELAENGLQVRQLEGRLHRFPLQFQLNRLRHVRLSGLARWLIRALEYTSSREPSTWMVLCQKRQE